MFLHLKPMRLVLVALILPLAGAVLLEAGLEAALKKEGVAGLESKLASTRFHKLQFAHRIALRDAAAKVADRMSWVLADTGVSQEERAKAARVRLNREADRLLEGSELVRRYAETAPDGLLVAPIYKAHFDANSIPEFLTTLAKKGFNFVQKLAEANVGKNSSWTGETEWSSTKVDAEGKMIKETTRCVNGQCETLQEEGLPASAPGVVDDGLSREVRNLAGALSNSESSFDEEGFNQLLGGAFGDHSSWLTFPKPRWGVDLPMPMDFDEFSQAPKWGTDRAMNMLGNMMRGVTGRSTSSESTETFVKNGVLVRKTQKCEASRCWTAIQEEPLVESYPMMAESAPVMAVVSPATFSTEEPLTTPEERDPEDQVAQDYAEEGAAPEAVVEVLSVPEVVAAAEAAGVHDVPELSIDIKRIDPEEQANDPEVLVEVP